MTAYGAKVVKRPRPINVNPQTGKTYTVQPAPGGVFHVYGDGRRVFVRSGGAAPSAPPAAPPSASAASQAAFAPDSQYFAEAGQQTFNGEQQRAQIDAEGQTDRTGVGEALRRMADQQRQATQNTTQGANREGLFYSGALGQRLGDLAKNYAQSRSDTNENFAARERARATARAAIDQGMTVSDAAMMAAAADRQIAGDSEAASHDALTLNPTPQPLVSRAPTAPPIRTLASKKAIRAVGAHAKVLHIPSDRRRPARKKR